MGSISRSSVNGCLETTGRKFVHLLYGRIGLRLPSVVHPSHDFPLLLPVGHNSRGCGDVAEIRMACDA